MTGGCLCGAVRYRVEGPLGPIVACHCSQCRKMSGHLAAFATIPRDALRVEGRVTWYESTPGEVRRGFCAVCGSNLFWERMAEDTLDLWVSMLDAPTGVRVAYHIYVADKGDYYEITDGLPQYAGAGPEDDA